MSTMPPTVGTGLPPKQSTWPTVIGTGMVACAHSSQL